MGDLRSAALPPLGPEDHVRGDSAATLVIVYADFTCPHCALTHARLGSLSLRRAFRHFALAARHPRAVPLACAAEAAARQGRFWEMHDALFEDPGHQDDPHLWQRAEGLGLDLGRFEADRRDPAIAERVREQVRAGMRGGVTATPTLVVDGELVPGPLSAEALRSLVAR
jgi:protein-disulfide isomerase